MPLIETALREKFIIPEFADFTSKIDQLYKECIDISGGKVCVCVYRTCSSILLFIQAADYIPELARVDTSKWGISLCTINGQRSVTHSQ